MSAVNEKEKHPAEKGPKPPFPQQRQEAPGHEKPLAPPADHGESTYRGSGRLKGKAALITGSDSGIGRAVALAFAREGADVLISYLSEHKDAEATANLVEDAGQKAVTVAGDIQDEGHCQSLVQKALDEFGKLDILVNNAAFQLTYDKISDIPAEEWDRVFRTNIYAMFYLCKAALPRMQQGGSIINTASIQAFHPNPILLPYATTKGAIVTFTRALAQEAIEYGVRVNAVAPGPVWTPLIPYSMPDEAVKQFGKKSVIGRPAQPKELAPVYVLLASEEASYITGEVYGVTGGEITQ
ncbi:MAG TPA: glucose 1-dehydrogenase [Armatimonadota bacterium]|nr:glucose 1-dehydrogenase [Armatimonadota bacterium]